MKVKDLKILLEKFPDDAYVIFTYEGTAKDAKPDNFYLDYYGNLLLDADESHYK